jgi:uncharacterized protein YndB with AHSA1/START domain
LSSSDPSGRSIALHVEVPAAPEQAWEAIATGPGISAWFVPARVEERVGGAVSLSFGPGMDETGRVTAFEPPRRFAYDAPVEGDRRLGYEWTVDERPEGGSVVRLLNRGFGDGPEWDGELAGMDAGWRLFLENLRLHLTHFAGEPCTPVLASASAPGPLDRAWGELTQALGLPAMSAPGDRVAISGSGAPALAGTVERSTDGMLTLLLEPPDRGVALFAAEGGDDSVALSVWLYPRGGTDASAWPAWLGQRFPSS